MSLLAFIAVVALQTPAAREVAIGDLLGRSRVEVASLLEAQEPAPAETLTLVEGDKAIELHAGTSLQPGGPAEHLCRTRLLAPGEEGDQPLSDAVFTPTDRTRVAAWVFEQGLLAAVRVTRPLPRTPPPTSPQAFMERAIQQGARNGWTAEAGRLPLASGLAFGPGPGFASAADRVVTACRLLERPSGRRPFDDAGLVQGLALLPFAVALPSLNAERERAAREGPILMAQLEPGRNVPGGVSAYVHGRRGVRLYRDPEDMDYGVVVISHGWDQSNNLSRYNDAGMVGVRGDQVVWRAGPQAAEALGLRQAMCVDANGRVGQARPGCSNTGQFLFGD